MAGQRAHVIQVGEVLDKYELLERVGQGGMAVVYRGLDRSLKRVVAVKILHKHLSDYQEARDRFEREAQAVAKLRHENILEIFDYSGAEAAQAEGSCYIVTEFIEGGTLKEVITARPITFPEIGAMVMVQVCRALAHAHAAGILHRDVKPENIMIRSDGVVKLMDFGISHMVDLERLTVTGQLLGSPAYMAPEHVEGRQLDFRTDVFAAGIVLYQLTVGKLPFEGKNPHEVLKKIAECKFVDPREANARIGNRLGRIILRAMAAEPKDRFASVGEMVTALEKYLEESGIAADKIASELGRYFSAPPAYELALEERLIDTLTRRGEQLLKEDDRAGALDAFDRVLTIDADNQKVIAILEGINRRTRMKASALAVLACGVIAFGAYMIHRRSLPPELEVPSTIGNGTLPVTGPSTVVQNEPDAPAAPAVVEDAGVVDAPEQTAGSGSARPPIAPDAAPVIVAQPIKVMVSPWRGTEVQLGDGMWMVMQGDELMQSIDRALVVRVRNDCCFAQEREVQPGQPDVSFELQFKPARIIPTCKEPGTVDVRINDGTGFMSATLGEARSVFFEGTLEEKPVTIEFTVNKKLVEKTVRIQRGQTQEVSCAQP